MSKNELLHDDFNVAQTACQVLKLEDITDQKIKFAMSKIWPGHGFAEPDSFKTVESAIEYCLKVEESCDEFYDGRLAASGAADDCRGLSRHRREADVFENLLLGIRIAEGNVSEFNGILRTAGDCLCILRVRNGQFSVENLTDSLH